MDLFIVQQNLAMISAEHPSNNGKNKVTKNLIA